MKQEIVAGDTLDFLTTVADYPATDLWTLVYRLVPRDSTGTAIEISASASGSDYRSQVSPTDTALWVAGEYSWTSWVEKTGARYSVDQGIVTILPDPATVAAGYDNRSPARKIIDAIDAMVAGRATIDQQEYEIASGGSMRRLRYCSRTELLEVRSYYAAIVAREEARERAAAGLSDQSRTYVRFSGRA